MERADARRIAACAWALAVAGWLAWYDHFSPALAVDFICKLAVGVPIVVLAHPRGREWARRVIPVSWRGAALIWVMLFALVVVNATATQLGAPTFIPIWAVYFALPIMLFMVATTPSVRLIGGAALIVLPVGLLPMIQLAAPDREPLTVGVLVIVDLMLLLVLVYRPDEQVDFALWLPGRALVTAVKAFAAYAIVALPLALLLHFIRPGLGQPTIAAAIGRFVALFFLVAIPEELVGRGLLQNGLERVVGNARGLWIAAVIFGLAHIGHPPAPNWRYVLLATGAGLVYGWVYQKTRNVAASAVTHALVDWTWSVLFAGLIGI